MTEIVRASITLDGPQVLRGMVHAGSTLYFTATFRDATQQLVTPAAVSWKLIDLDSLGVITSGVVATPATTTNIVIPGSANSAHDPGRKTEWRALIVTARYNASDTIKAQKEFMLRWVA